MRLSDFFIRSQSRPIPTSTRHRIPTKAAIATLSSRDASVLSMSGGNSDEEEEAAAAAVGRASLI